jgi:Tfp pilus assembly protein FimT
MNIFTDTRQQFSEGFTLIEAIIFVLILGISAMSAFPSLQSGLEESKLSGAAAEVTVALEYAQLAAMTTGKQTSVTIDAAADAVLVERYRINGDILSGALKCLKVTLKAGVL